MFAFCCLLSRQLTTRVSGGRDDPFVFFPTLRVKSFSLENRQSSPLRMAPRPLKSCRSGRKRRNNKLHSHFLAAAEVISLSVSVGKACDRSYVLRVHLPPSACKTNYSIAIITRYFYFFSLHSLGFLLTAIWFNCWSHSQ